ncbi:MAG: hypothetical protein AAFU77_16740 [Myxococcota bacterium]
MRHALLWVPLLVGCDPVFELELEVVAPVASQMELSEQMPVELRLQNIVDPNRATPLGVLCEVGESDARFEFRDEGVCGEETRYEIYFVAVDECVDPSGNAFEISESDRRVGPAVEVTFFEGFTGGNVSDCAEGLERQEVRLE